MTTTPTAPLDVRAEQLASLAKGDDYAWIATAYKVTGTQAMVAFNRGETVLVSERDVATLEVHAITTTHHRSHASWADLRALVDADLAVGRPRTWYVVLTERDADGNPWPLAYTINRVRIVPGLRVRDYNWRETTVTDARPSLDGPRAHLGEGTPWFTTANGGFFDGSRLTAL